MDAVTIACSSCGNDVGRIPEVGDAWLDAGIVPFSTLGWNNPEWIEHGYATGAASGLSDADLPDHAYWEQWFPADWISEMREQIRLWFYSISFMSMTLVGRSPYKAVLTYEKLLDEHGREMHRSWGNSIAADEALDRMGDRVAHPPDLAVPALPDRDLDPRARPRPRLHDAQEPDFRGQRPPAVDDDAVTQPLQIPFVGNALDECFVRPVQLVAGMRHPLGKVAVVGQDDQPFGIEVEPADRIEVPADAGARHQADDRRPPLRIGSGAHDAARLVEQQIPAPGDRLQPAPVDFDLVTRRIGLGPELQDDVAVDRHAPLTNQLVGRAP